MTAAVALLAAAPAYADGELAGGQPPGGGAGGGTVSDGPVVQNGITGSGMTCAAYASGAGIGHSCVSTSQSSGALKTLRERFPNQPYQRCRYDEFPPGYPAPPDRAGEGRWMFMTCLENIDLDTYNGGPDRSLSMFPVWVLPGVVTIDADDPLSTFLWEQFEQSNQLPVPALQAKPNSLPIVNDTTYFTFRWIDPATQETVADPEGPYAGRPEGGPWMQINSGPFVMRAVATSLKLDPQQSDMKPKVCRDVSTPYVEGAEQQPDGACSYIFERASAVPEKYATAPIPPDIERAFWMSVEVEWRITYGFGDPDTPLADGFTMRVHQAVPVQEIQAPNEPPMVMFP